MPRRSSRPQCRRPVGDSRGAEQAGNPYPAGRWARADTHLHVEPATLCPQAVAQHGGGPDLVVLDAVRLHPDGGALWGHGTPGWWPPGSVPPSTELRTEEPSAHFPSHQGAPVRAAVPQPVLPHPEPQLPPLENGLMMPGSKGPWGSHEITGTATPGPGQSQALSASGPSAHLPCAPSSVPWGQAQDRDTPGPLPFASQGFKSRKGLWRPGVPTGNPRLGPMCGLRWVTCPITVTLRPWHGPRAVTPALQPPYTPTAPPLLAALTPTPSPPHLSRCPKPPSPHTPSASLIFSAGAHSSSSSSPFRGPGGKKGREEVLRAPEQPGAWLTSHGDPGCAGPAPRDTPLWSLPFSTVHLSSVSSSLGDRKSTRLNSSH